MSESEILQKFMQIVPSLYSPDYNETSKANWKWMEEFQSSNEAWIVCFQVMKAGVSEDVTFYAALTLQTKIRYDIEKMPISQQNEMVGFLVEYLNEYRPKMKITREICTGLANIAVKCPEWMNAFAHLVGELGRIITSATNVDDFGPEKAIIYFISEYANIIPDVGASRKDQIRLELCNSFEDISQMMEYFVTLFSNDLNYSKLIYKTFGELVTTGAFPFDKVIESHIFQNIMVVISSYGSIDLDIVNVCVQAFNDCLSLLILSDRVERAVFYEKFQSFSSKLFPLVLKAIENSDFEYLKYLIDIHMTLLDGFEEEVINDAQCNDSHIFLDVVSKICDFNDARLIFETFNFWIDFTTNVLNSVFNQTFLYPFFEKYGNISIKQIYDKMPVELDYINETLYVLDDNDVTDFRVQSLDALISLFSILDPINYYNLVMSHIKTGQLSIIHIEAALYFLLGVLPSCKNVNLDDLIQIILSFPADSPQLLLETSCKIFSIISSSLDEINPQIEQIFGFLFQCLKHYPIQMAASEALIVLSTKFSSNLSDKFNIVLSIVSESVSRAKDSDVVDSLTKCCAIFISKSDPEIIHIQLESLCLMQLNYANNLFKANGYSKSIAVYAPIDMVGSIFKFLLVPKDTDRAPFQPLINQIIIFSVEVLEMTRYSDDLCEKICRLLRYVIKFMGPSYCLRREISTKAVEWFINSGRSSFMYLMCTIVDVYSRDIINQEWILNDFLLFCQPAILSLNQDNVTVDFPYLLEDYIRLCIKIYQFTPVSFLSSEICKPVILTTIKGLLCDNKKSFNTCHAFLSIIFKEKFYERDVDRLIVKDSVAVIFTEFCHLIIKYCLQNIFSRKSLFIIEFSGELLVVILKYNQISQEFIVSEIQNYINNFNASTVNEYIKKLTNCNECCDAGRFTRKFSIDMYGH